MMENIFLIAVRVLGAFLAIFSFGVLIEIPKKFILKAGFVGAVGGLGYQVCMLLNKGDVTSSFVSALLAAVVAHTFARVYKTPVTLFLIAGVLPTVPGAGMYRTVHYILEENEKMAAHYLIQTLEIAGVIALAIFVVDTIFQAAQQGEWQQNSMKYVRQIKLTREDSKK